MYRNLSESQDALDGTYGNAEGCITNSAVENSWKLRRLEYEWKLFEDRDFLLATVLLNSCTEEHLQNSLTKKTKRN